MFARVAAGKDSSRSTGGKVARTDRADASTLQPHPVQYGSAQPDVKTYSPRFSWSIGNIAVCRENERQQALPLPWPMQAKLEVGAGDDPLEREADQVSSQVLRMPDAVTAARGPMMGAQVPRVQRKCSCGGTCAACRGETAGAEQGTVQRSPPGPRVSRLGSSPGGSAMTAPPSVHKVLSSPGRPLDPAIRGFMEPRFGYDFGSVRLHTGETARRSAEEVGAHAYTVGEHIVLRGESASRGLLAHELTHVVQQNAAPTPLVQRDDKPGLDSRLSVVEETGAAANARLAEIILKGPMPPADQTKVIGAAIIDVEGYTGPREMRALSGADTDALGQGAAVYHAKSPDARALSATRGINAPAARREFPWAHINDAEMKIFEDILPRLPPNAKGTIHFMTMRKLRGVPTPEPYAACSGCIRASFEFSGRVGNVDVVSHAPVHPAGTVDMNAHPGGGQETPIENPRNLPPKVVQTTPRDANVEQSTGRVVPGQGTDAANAARTQRLNTPAAGHGTDVHEGGGGDVPAGRGAVQTGHATELATGIGMGVASVGLGWLAAKLKAKVDARIANKQIAALLEAAKRKINANPNDALKKMMQYPDAQVYAWVHLDSAVITTYSVDAMSPEPVANDSAPLISLGPVEYATGPVPPELAQGFPQISGGGSHSMVIHTIILDLPIPSVPLETLIAYAKERGLALDDLRPYVLQRFKAAIDSAQTGLDARAAIFNALNTNDATWKLLDKQYRAAEKRKDIEAQKALLTSLMRIDKSNLDLNASLREVNDIIARQDATLKHWEDVMDLVKASGP